MGPKVEVGQRIIDYLEGIYPESKTLAEISRAIGLQSCSAQPWITTLLASKDIETSGKKGRSNLYRFMKA